VPGKKAIARITEKATANICRGFMEARDAAIKRSRL
jgi:hypothetical protein